MIRFGKCLPFSPLTHLSPSVLTYACRNKTRNIQMVPRDICDSTSFLGGMTRAFSFLLPHSPSVTSCLYICRATRIYSKGRNLTRHILSHQVRGTTLFPFLSSPFPFASLSFPLPFPSLSSLADSDMQEKHDIKDGTVALFDAPPRSCCCCCCCCCFGL